MPPSHLPGHAVSELANRKVLVAGGAGYIGSHMVKALLDAGCRVVTFDDLSSGHRDAVVGGEFVQGNIGDPAALASLFSTHRFDAAMLFAGSIQVGESGCAHKDSTGRTDGFHQWESGSAPRKWRQMRRRPDA